jgi:hypothetical protein
MVDEISELWARALEWIRESLDYLRFSLMEGDWLTALLIAFLLLVLLFVILAVLVNFWELFLSNMPYLSTHPIGLPPSRKYLVRVENSEAYEFSWSYPYLIVGGSRYRFNKYVIDKDNPLRFQTANGTLFEFIRNPETIRS